jgi:hypothetical protein
VIRLEQAANRKSVCLLLGWVPVVCLDRLLAVELNTPVMPFYPACSGYQMFTVLL